jgi:hypothetical protein
MEWRTLPVTGRYERNFNSPPAVITPSPGLRTLLRPCKSIAPPSASSAQAACLAAFFRLRQPKDGLSIAVARPLTSDQGGAFHGSRRGFSWLKAGLFMAQGGAFHGSRRGFA